MKIAIVDHIGLKYNAKTVENYALGGSESAIIFMAKELQKIGFSVTVYNNCIDSRAGEGIFDDVQYIDISRLRQSPNKFSCDILISSRTTVPFLPENLWGSTEASIFTGLRNSAKYKILWLHDTFIQGDLITEELVVNNHIHEIFTLSDFHTTYIANCDHGKRRNFEVLKNKIYMTRNGAVKYIDNVNIADKDKNLFVFNASATKGMLALVDKVWPKVKKYIPDAKLVIIGGYYRFADNSNPDEQENTVQKLSRRADLKDLNIVFSGILPQHKVAEVVAKASFMIYPAVFPETFGISTLESLLYNTPLITTRFGALEETAVDLACYKIDYPVEPNSLFQQIDSEKQVEKFVRLVVEAYNNTYLHYQKMNYCNIVHDIAGWDGIALQWKQHIYKKMGTYLSADEYRKVQSLNNRIHQVFGRKYSNHEEWEYPKTSPQQNISIISPFFNAEQYIRDCILSVATQDYDNYTHYLIDDCSTDNSFKIAKQTIESLPDHLQTRFKLKKNTQNKGAVENQITAIQKCKDNDIIMMLDGDDCLVNNNTIFHLYNNLYNQDTEFTYGSMWSMVDNIPLIAQKYPVDVKENREYRKYKFPWNMPYTHLRTFKKYLINDIDLDNFKDENGNWFRAGGDTSIFYNLIEVAHPDKIKVVTDIVYKYNDKNPLNDYKVNSQEQQKTAEKVMSKTKTYGSKKKILIAIPTNKYIEPETFKSIYDLTIPEDVEVTFQYFFGYQIDQIRNLIAHWAEKYDYLFSVDSDIVLPNDSLVKMINHDVDIVSGVYIQRKLDVEILEIYRKNHIGGDSNISLKELQPPGLHEISSCGFGCVLVKSDVIRKIGYPQFTYKSALNHKNTISEDVDFCRKAKENGARIYVDSTIICDHIGTTIFRPKGV